MQRLAVCGSLLFLAAASFAQRRPLGDEEQAAALDAVRAYAVNYTERLPNYTCDQVIRRRTNFVLQSIAVAANSRVDAIEEQTSFAGHRETHRITKINGRPAAGAELASLGGTFSQGEFGSLLDNIFSRATGSALKWERAAALNGRRVYVFAFQVPASGGYALVESARTVKVSYKGLVYADAQSSEILCIEMTCVDIPADSVYKEVALTLDYKPTLVAGQEYILPSHYRLLSRRADLQTTSEADYKAYRRFAADATITFGDERR
jgi:hypothetical protein